MTAGPPEFPASNVAYARNTPLLYARRVGPDEGVVLLVCRLDTAPKFSIWSLYGNTLGKAGMPTESVWIEFTLKGLPPPTVLITGLRAMSRT